MSTRRDFNNEINRLCFPVSRKLYDHVHKEFNAIRSLLLKDGYHRIYCSPRLCNTRYFSTTPRFSNKNGNEGPSRGPSKGPQKDPKRPSELQVMLAKVLLIVFCLLFTFVLSKRVALAGPWEPNRFMWDDFVKEMLLKGEVEQITVYGSTITVHLNDGAVYKGNRFTRRSFSVYDPTYAKIIEDKIRDLERSIGIKAEDGVSIKYVHGDNDASLLSLAFVALCIYAIVKLIPRMQNLPNPMSFITQKTKAKYTLVEPFSGKGVRFDDVAGLKEAKIEVMEFVDYLKQPERYKKLGAKVPKGALLLGPPGCGKTLLAKAVATESNVPFLSMNGSEFIEMLGGLGAARVRDLFAEARKRAPSIIYIDEIDAVGKKRSDQGVEFGNNESERTLNQLLVEMDGMTTSEDVIILASTNRAEVLDTALLRPGRFDRHILIDLPTLDERKQIFEYHLKCLSLEGKPSKYSGYLASLTPGFSGADIANVCNEAALHAARDKKTTVAGGDLMYAIDRTIGGITKKTNTLTPSTKKVVAYHEAGHALVGWLLEHTSALLKVTIIPRTNMSLGFAQYSQKDQKLHSTEELFQMICMMLGGRVAESLTFNKISTGAENDLKKVTKIAYHQVQQFGMSPTVGLISFDEEVTSTRNKKPYSKKMANVMDAEVRKIITSAYKATEKLLTDNADKLALLAEALLQKETLTYDDVEKLLGPPPFGKKRLIEPTEFIADVEPPLPEPTPQ